MKLKLLSALLGLVFLTGCATTVSTGVVYTDPFPHTIIYYDEWRGYGYYWQGNYHRYYAPPPRHYYRPIAPRPMPPRPGGPPHGR